MSTLAPLQEQSAATNTIRFVSGPPCRLYKIIADLEKMALCRIHLYPEGHDDILKHRSRCCVKPKGSRCGSCIDGPDRRRIYVCHPFELSNAQPMKQNNEILSLSKRLRPDTPTDALPKNQEEVFHTLKSFRSPMTASTLFVSESRIKRSFKKGEFIVLIIACMLKVVVMGDFNEVCFASERHGSTFYASNAAEFNMFITNSHFIDVPLDSWNNDGVHASNAMIQLKNKLKSLKQTLKTQTEEVFLMTCQIEQRLFHDIGVIDCKKPVDMAQKAKVKWAIEGDENYKFFHSIVNKKRHQQAIKDILVDSEFSAPDWSRVPIKGIFTRRLGADSSHYLKGLYIPYLMKLKGGDGEDLSNSVKEFFNSSNFPKGYNPSFIALILKFLKLNVLMMMLHGYCLVFSLKVNVHKISLYGLGVHSSDIQCMANSFGYLANNLPFMYLSVKVAANMARINSWNGVIQKVPIKLSNGKLNPYRWEVDLLF
ncbi:hypothetical protein Tco_1227387 [Tanacetum coccineum]